MAPKYRLLADRLLIKMLPDEGEVKTASGIIIPDEKDSAGKVRKGKIVRVSKKIENNSVEEERLSVGETVIISQHAGNVMKIGVEEYRVLRATDCMCVEDDTLEDIED